MAKRVDGVADAVFTCREVETEHGDLEHGFHGLRMKALLARIPILSLKKGFATGTIVPEIVVSIDSPFARAAQRNAVAATEDSV